MASILEIRIGTSKLDDQDEPFECDVDDALDSVRGWIDDYYTQGSATGWSEMLNGVEYWLACAALSESHLTPG